MITKRALERKLKKKNRRNDTVTVKVVDIKKRRKDRQEIEKETLWE
jgi:uncharacterized protein (DUF39 family)